jgi:hypothetical protein
MVHPVVDRPVSLILAQVRNQHRNELVLAVGDPDVNAVPVGPPVLRTQMQPAADHAAFVRSAVRGPTGLDPALHGHVPEALGEDVQPLQFADGLGRKCPGAQEYNGNGDALLLQLDQQIEAGLLRQDDDDVDIDGVAERAEQRAAIAETPDDEALPGQFAGQGLAVDQVAIEEKDANRICLADRAMQLPRSVARGYDILFKHRRHLKTLSIVCPADSSTGRARRPILRGRPNSTPAVHAPARFLPPRES